jgi:hypothetical protein
MTVRAPAFKGVISAVCDSTPIVGIWFNDSFLWPDPWTDIWEEGGTAPLWQNEWRNQWSESNAEIID